MPSEQFQNLIRKLDEQRQNLFFFNLETKNLISILYYQIGNPRT
jgi:hypothetical protein